MAFRTASTQVVRDAIRAGEEDFLSSFLQLCTLSRSTHDPNWPELEASLTQQLAGTSWRRLSPWAYLGYFLIGSHLISNEEPETLPLGFINSEICRAQDHNDIVDFGDIDRAPPQLWNFLLSHFQQGGDFVSGLESPEKPLAEFFRQKIRESRLLIKEIDYELGELMDHLQNTLILAKPDQKSRLANESFGGATCFFFRGASVLNASRASGLDRITEQLVHEYAHAELFVLGQDEPLCTNPDADRHQVLIRNAPRPMNGILHSLYVVARVSEWIHQLLKQRPANAIGDELNWPDWEKLLNQQQNYGASSLKAVQRYASLTKTGEYVVQTSMARLALACSS